MAPLVNKFVTAIGRNQDMIARNFTLGLAALLGMVLSFFGVKVNAYQSNAREVKSRLGKNIFLSANSNLRAYIFCEKCDFGLFPETI